MHRIRIALVISVLMVLFVGCGSDSSGPEGTATADFSGRWSTQLEVVGKRACEREVGTTRNAILEIAQQGNVVVVLLESSTVDLAASGSRATGSATVEDRGVEFDLRISGGELTGTLTISDPSVPCTQVESMTGSRANATPSREFRGDWDLEITITQSDCPGEEVGSKLQVCRSIDVRNSTISIDEEGGVILGVGDGSSAELGRFSEDEWLRIDLTVSGNTLAGTIDIYDLVGQCSVRGSITGTKRSTACGEGGSGGDFAGYWSITPTVVTNTCGFPIGPDCLQFTQDGNTVAIPEDGLEGTVSGNTLTIRQQEALDATVTLTIDLTLQLSGDGNSFSGTQSITIVDSENPESACETTATMSGTRVTDCVRNAAPGIFDRARIEMPR